jgi:hypothetical protein
VPIAKNCGMSDRRTTDRTRRCWSATRRAAILAECCKTVVTPDLVPRLLPGTRDGYDVPSSSPEGGVAGAAGNSVLLHAMTTDGSTSLFTVMMLLTAIAIVLSAETSGQSEATRGSVRSAVLPPKRVRPRWPILRHPPPSENSLRPRGRAKNPLRRRRFAPGLLTGLSPKPPFSLSPRPELSKAPDCLWISQEVVRG